MGQGALRLHGWRSRPVLAVAILMAAAGYAQFGPTAVLADVARDFGEVADGDTIAERAGLPGSVLGAGLAVIRLASLVALVLAGLADRLGRRTAILWWVGIGLLATGVAALAPSYWWFVAAAAVARPMLTATVTLGEVLSAEHTSSAHRAAAVALTAAAYGVGSGAVAVLRALSGGDFGFRAALGTSALLLVLLVPASRLLTEPDRFRLGVRAVPVLGAVAPDRRRRLALLAMVVFAASLVTGPGNTFLFLYAESVLGAGTGFTAAIVVAGGVAGLAGLLGGRLLADRWGRCPTVAAGLVALAATAWLTYSGSVPAVAIGYPLSLLVGSAFAVSSLTLAAELFPTSSRASAAGWLVAVGVLGAATGLLVVGWLADGTGSFSWSMAAVCVPAALAATVALLLPETRGLELEESAPDVAVSTT